jgi:cold shock CspA family protein
MERYIEWSDKGGGVAFVKSPETGDEVFIGCDAVRAEIMFRINRGPSEKLPRGMDERRPLAELGMQLLQRHISQCRPTDAEELTLP